MLYNILKDQLQMIEIDRIRSITQETEFSQMAELLYISVYYFSMCTLDTRIVVATNSTRVLPICSHLNSRSSSDRAKRRSYYFIVGSSSDSRKTRTATPTIYRVVQGTSSYS